MDRYGIQGIGFMLLLSILIVMFLNNHVSLEWGTSSSSASSVSTPTSGSSKSGSFGIEALHPSIVGGERRRQLLQAIPAPAPAPSSSGTGGYISYGALSAGYVPCPVQTGRSYYTQNCQTTTAPVNPYTRGCQTITLCARGGS